MHSLGREPQVRGCQKNREPRRGGRSFLRRQPQADSSASVAPLGLKFIEAIVSWGSRPRLFIYRRFAASQ